MYCRTGCFVICTEIVFALEVIISFIKILFCSSSEYDCCVCSILLSGILCGECEADTGVTILTNTCSRCNSANISLIPVLSMLNYFNAESYCYCYCYCYYYYYYQQW